MERFTLILELIDRVETLLREERFASLRVVDAAEALFTSLAAIPRGDRAAMTESMAVLTNLWLAIANAGIAAEADEPRKPRAEVEKVVH